MSEISDEQLGRILWETMLDQNGFRDTTADRDRIWNGDDYPGLRESYTAMGQAARAALTPAVAPLRPGETVTIPTVNGMETGGIRIMGNERVMAFSIESSDGWWDGRFLDAAGVDQLMETCRRWKEAQREQR